MALSLTKDYTFAPNTVIASAEVNQDFDELYNAFAGLEAGTSSMSKLPLDANPSSALHAATKQYVDAYANYKRPNLSFNSVTTVDVMNNTGTANQTKIVFYDGETRSVTEDVASTTKYRRFDITATAEFTTGTEDSGLRSGISEIANTRYAIYAVKSAINTANFVLAGDTTFPTQGNYSTLNTRYGTLGWVFLGYIFNGAGQGGNSDICDFIQAGPLIMFRNTVSGGVGLSNPGIEYATTAGATTLSYTYAAGSANAQIPDTITDLLWGFNFGAVAGSAIVKNQAASRVYWQWHANNTISAISMWTPASEGVQLSNGPGSSITYDIDLRGYYDGALGVGSNPMF